MLVALQHPLLGVVGACPQFLVGLELCSNESILHHRDDLALGELGLISLGAQPLVVGLFGRRVGDCCELCTQHKLASLLAGRLVLGRLVGLGLYLFGPLLDLVGVQKYLGS